MDNHLAVAANSSGSVVLVGDQDYQGSEQIQSSERGCGREDVTIGIWEREREKEKRGAPTRFHPCVVMKMLREMAEETRGRLRSDADLQPRPTGTPISK